MKHDVERDQTSMSPRGGGPALDSSAEGGTRVRLSWLTWESLACLAVLTVLCVVFGEDPAPVDDDGMIALSGHTEMVETVRFSPDGESLVTSSWDGSIRLWDVGRSTQRSEQAAAVLPGESEMFSAAFSPDGRTIAAVGLQGLTIWNWRDHQSFPEVEPRFGPCRSAAYAPDGRTLAVGGFDRRIHLWDVESDRALAVLNGPRAVVRTMAFLPDGSMLMAHFFDGSLKFWDSRTYREVDRLQAIGDRVHTLCLSRDGRALALSRLSGQCDRIEIWDLKSNTLKAVCAGHRSGVHALVFSPDGKTLVSAGGDQVLRFWDAETGNPAGRPERRIGWVRALDLSKDGRWLALSGTPNKVWLEPIDLAPRPH